ncbi:hypothetical protein [Kitasatospora sp. NBC_01302]|uniref:hypothetical protein n=1 Tax=Kitasatospora sp. NBC_01302 TaxID=2903575 RepID=UPI002E1223F1|nr:hypothetical protein OG294_20060 [Kitasatospora sp. NBC_01302]
MTLNRDIAALTRRIQDESGNTIPFQQARLTAERELGGLPIHTMAPEERIPLRVEYTGESEDAARSAIGGATRGLGLDHCSDDQRAFRALLALALFNGNVYTGPTARWGYAIVASYDPVMSPRWDQLVMVAERAPENVASRLLATDYERTCGLAGLRYQSHYWRGGDLTLRLRHLPTGAMLTVTSDPACRERGRTREQTKWRKLPTVRDALTGHEREMLASVPPMTADAATLLAGLVSRYNLVDRRGHWATSLSWDPLGRPEVECRKDPELMEQGAVRRLWGTGASWMFRWTGYPESRDLALALTHREAGIKGAGFTRRGDSYQVSLGVATLELCDGKG